MLKSEQISLWIGIGIIAIMAGIGVRAVNYVSSPEFTEQMSRNVDENEFSKLTSSQGDVPDFLISEEDEFVTKNKLSEVAKTSLKSETAYFLFLDKLIVSYYLSQEDIQDYVKDNWQYDIGSLEPIGFKEANEYYDKVIGEYKRTLGKQNEAQLINPNSLTSTINNYLVYADFLFEKPENLKISVSGLKAYFELVTTINPTEEMLQNPNPDLCTIARINPDLRHLPEELECNF